MIDHALASWLWSIKVNSNVKKQFFYRKKNSNSKILILLQYINNVNSESKGLNPRGMIV